ncbi:HD domain-containing protein [Oryzomonas rubra]|uniref:HD domain-containing protein n=1 Tax=Oryzomonas rubra TaxID=2509454 RepID=A0A5A9XFV6_9BACT|nr:HD domain-containing protein [Oryzomonas rubra]KAA0892092.1 HD domain-containing protein [Oryzomonas rubra]
MMADSLPTPLEAFYSGLHDFAQEFAGNKRYHKKFPKDAKIIHDPLWGTIKLEPWEVALLDLPLFQRLRQIHQTSLVSYVFPGCSHTRFEHTLGVVQQAQRLIDAVNKQYPLDKPRYEPTTVRSLRLAALFHDCGHSCFSHISEELYEACPDMVAFRETEKFSKCHPHEAFSALILQSEPVRQYIAEIEKQYEIEFDIQKAADWITGKPDTENGKRHYETQVINGPFDADKLDYIFRDAHYSGVPVGLDLDRLWASCRVDKTEADEKVLTLHQASVAPLEQILFSKINLFAIVYQHPKVRAAEKMFQSIIEEAKENPKACHFMVSGRALDLNKATDYLWLTDEVFFAEALHRDHDDRLHRKLHDIRYRRFLVRALTISNDSVDKDCHEGFIQLRKLNQRGPEIYKAKREIAQEIINAAGLRGEVELRDVWVDLPSDPSFGEADRTFVRTSAGTLRKVSDLFPIHYWTELYQKYKWRGHVFCPQEFQQKIHEAALDVFNSCFGLKFNKSAGESAHVPEPKATA